MKKQQGRSGGGREQGKVWSGLYGRDGGVRDLRPGGGGPLGESHDSLTIEIFQLLLCRSDLSDVLNIKRIEYISCKFFVKSYKLRKILNVNACCLL